MRSRLTRWQKNAVAAVVVAAFFGVVEHAHAIEVEAVVWGFDGKVVPNEFNPMSVLVFNPSADPFDGQMKLVKNLNGDIQRKGAVLIEPVFVSPFTRRWVQFYPFIQRAEEEWSISWDPGRGRDKKPHQPLLGKPAHVLMDSAASLSRGGSLRMFDEDLFPPYVAATTGLASVTFDHQPRNWQKPQQDAFLDWIRAGGDLHILHDNSGEFPQFEQGLVELNTPVEKVRMGAGTIYRHARARGAVDRDFVDGEILQLPKQPAAVVAEPPADQMDTVNSNQNMMFAEVDQTLLRSLKGVTRPKHNWILIHCMSVVYILVVFPGCWLVGRKWRDYRIALGVLLATVVVFGFGFDYVGGQSYDDAPTVNTLAIVRPLSDGKVKIRSWTNIFGTGHSREKIALGNSGEIYDVVTHAGSGRIYSTAHEIESVSGFVLNGSDGRCLFDIPPYSSRETINAYKTDLKTFDAKASSWSDDGNRLQAGITVGKTFPAQAETMYALHGRQFYRVSRSGQQLTLGAPLGEFSQFLQSNNLQNQFAGPWGQDHRKPEEVFRDALTPLIARQLGITDDDDVKSFNLPTDRLRLYVYAELPRVLYMDNPEFPVQDGRVLYCFDIFKPDES